MRIRSIAIDHWRHLSNIRLQLDDDAALVCIVGANGTGKSHLLELISACAHRLGLSQGVDIPRGDPFSDEHDLSLQFYLAQGVSSAVDEDLSSHVDFASWDRTLTIRSVRDSGHSSTRIAAGGIQGDRQEEFAHSVVQRLNTSKSVHFLSLDADRAYPKKNVHINEIAQAYETDWAGAEYTRGRSFRSTTTLYDEWLKYFLAQENQSGSRLMQEMRRAKKSGVEPPKFTDHFEAYANALQKVLPQLVFTGVDSKQRTLLFDTTGLHLTFNQLSGGEREIAFLIGQMDRFGLRHGLLLIDEPELHLNADLIRTWVSYLQGTVETGQIWLATHSLEAVEAAGQKATFVLERNESTRKVDRLARLDTRPVLSALSRAVGTPAFSISQLRFVFVEGEEGVGERERFHRLAGAPQNVRFMECGSCNEVVRRVLNTRTLAKEAEAGLRIGGIVDRDFRSDSEVAALVNHSNVLVLGTHEIENMFLHPPTLAHLLEQNGIDSTSPKDLIRNVADGRAGAWIFQYALATRNAKSLPEIPSSAKDRAKSLSWQNFTTDREKTISALAVASEFDEDNNAKLSGILKAAVEAYERRRTADDFWKMCEGKQVLNTIARPSGFADSAALSQAALAVWRSGRVAIPEALAELRAYVACL